MQWSMWRRRYLKACRTGCRDSHGDGEDYGPANANSLRRACRYRLRVHKSYIVSLAHIHTVSAAASSFRSQEVIPGYSRQMPIEAPSTADCSQVMCLGVRLVISRGGRVLIATCSRFPKNAK
jgi:hypothetical protein